MLTNTAFAGAKTSADKINLHCSKLVFNKLIALPASEVLLFDEYFVR